VLRTLNSEVHPSRIHGLKHFFGRSGMAFRDAELLERFRPPCTRDCKGFHVEIQDFTQLLRDFIRGDYRTKVMRLDPLIPRAEKVVPVFESMGEDKVRVT
jgi:hypothetical protein